MECCSGHVGSPLACNMMKVVDVPEMSYFAKDNKGEVKCNFYCTLSGKYF